MMMVRDPLTAVQRGSGRDIMQGTFSRTRLVRVERGIVAVERRTIGADDFQIAAHVEKDVRMVERGLGAHAHEPVRANVDDRNARIVMEMWNDVVRHAAPIRSEFFPGPDHSGPMARFPAPFLSVRLVTAVRRFSATYKMFGNGALDAIGLILRVFWC
jgi:hypothetical protein